ncbi:HK97 family phage major capsid protein [Spinactinospora alkalitolerans]|uniref:HK97 family phage major capsid protein n=1 Tax=Spinactinospora alkalitolerans TaxID=687207 RepID=A0A852TM38_9ACTN|nr:phage major capsid protein [Spinactinospora alkalitolerans]NYE44998.1 HK97 family phage major capsid protein [Spinactinospora alkalitolerans]
MDSAVNAALLKPEQVNALVVQPFVDAATATQIGNVVRVDAPEFRIPVLTDDVDGAWTAEGADIPLSNMATEEVVVIPRKVAALARVTNELVMDSEVDSLNAVGASMVRDLARKVDAALFTEVTGAPAGLAQAHTSGTLSVITGTELINTDLFEQAVSVAATEGATTTAFVTSPATALRLAELKAGDGSNVPLLGADATMAARKQVAGVPLHVNRYVPQDVIYAIPQELLYIVLRQGTTVALSRDVYFGSDSVGVRAIMRVGFGIPHPKAVVRIELPAEVAA